MHDWLLGQKVYDGGNGKYHRFTIAGIDGDFFIIKTPCGRVESYSVSGLFAHIRDGFLKLLPESCESTVEKQTFNIPTAEEARKSSHSSVDREAVAKKVKKLIEQAQSKGEFSVWFPHSASSAEWEMVKNIVNPLGYRCIDNVYGKLISWRKYD